MRYRTADSGTATLLALISSAVSSDSRVMLTDTLPVRPAEGMTSALTRTTNTISKVPCTSTRVRHDTPKRSCDSNHGDGSGVTYDSPVKASKDVGMLVPFNWARVISKALYHPSDVR